MFMGNWDTLRSAKGALRSTKTYFIYFSSHFVKYLLVSNHSNLLRGFTTKELYIFN